MRYKLVIADVDGTIIPPSEYPAPYPSKRLIKAVEEVREKGVAFSIATGRALSYVENLIDGLKLISPVILDNGASIYDCKNGRFLWQSVMPKETARQVLNFLKKDKTLRVRVIDDGVRRENTDEVKYWKINRILVLGMTSKKAEALFQKLKVFSGLHIAKTISGVNPPRESILITNFDATKQIAIGKIIEILGIDHKEIIGIGDSYNDFPLLMACGFKVAMGNATDDIKAIADYIAPSYEEDGVAHILEKFILNEKNHLHNLLGEDKNQLLVVTDKKGNKLATATREECHKGEGRTHLAFMAFVFDAKKRIILTKRSKRKSLWAGFWDASVVSHVLPDETVEKAAKRRGKEELGIEIDFKDLGTFYYFAKDKNGVENEYCHVLVGKTTQQIIPNPVEIEAIKSISVEKFKNEVLREKQQYTPWLKLALKKFVDYLCHTQ